MLGYLILLFITVPIVELAILIKVGQHIGIFNTISIVVITGMIGALLAKSEGLKTVSGIQRDLNMGIIPSERLTDGLFILVGGLLLLTPGLITDVAGFVFLIPHTRYYAKRWLRYKFRRIIDGGEINFFTSSRF